ncbi:MAG: hypothetical protein WD066_13280 [Planctomycetaceae bacterium]
MAGPVTSNEDARPSPSSDAAHSAQGAPPRHWARRWAAPLAATATGLCCLALFLAIWPVEPRATFWDNLQYYFPSQAKIVRDAGPGAPADNPVTVPELLVTPFFRVVGNTTDVLVHEAKPVYIVALRLWGWSYRAVRPAAEFPSAFEYMLFVALTAWWMSFATWLVADRLGSPWIGLAAAILLLANGWQTIYLYLPHYTQFSTALLLCAFAQCLRATPRATFTAGIVGAVALLSNNAILVYLPGMALAAGFLGLPGWKRAAANAAAFAAGLFAVFAFFEALAHTEKIRHLCGDDVISPWTILYRYYEYSMHRAHFFELAGLDHTPKYLGVFFEILSRVSYLWLIAFIAGPLATAWCVFRKGWAESLRAPWLRGAIALWLVAIPAVAAIEFGPSIQLGRTYFPAVPFWLLATALVARHAWAEWFAARPVRMRAAWGALCLATLVYGVEFGIVLADQHRAFHAMVARTLDSAAAGDRVLFLRNDDGAQVAYSQVLLASSGEPPPEIGWADAEDGLEPIARQAREGTVLLLTGVPDSAATRKAAIQPPPEEVSRWLEELRSGRGPAVAELVDRWPHGRVPHVLVRYEDEHLDWLYREGLVDEDHFKIHVWKVTPTPR